VALGLCNIPSDAITFEAIPKLEPVVTNKLDDTEDCHSDALPGPSDPHHVTFIKSALVIHSSQNRAKQKYLTLVVWNGHNGTGTNVGTSAGQSQHQFRI
jgi:hypothetical protein